MVRGWTSPAGGRYPSGERRLCHRKRHWFEDRLQTAAGVGYAFVATHVTFDVPAGTLGRPDIRRDSNVGGLTPSLTVVLGCRQTGRTNVSWRTTETSAPVASPHSRGPIPSAMRRMRSLRSGAEAGVVATRRLDSTHKQIRTGISLHSGRQKVQGHGEDHQP